MPVNSKTKRTPDAGAVVASLRKLGSKKVRDGMSRYAIPNDKAFGISMSTIQGVAKKIGRDHDLALALWDTGWYDARMVAVFVGEPERLTPTQMDRWARQFENWAVCDTACFKLFDQSPHAFAKIATWSRHRDEFVKRGAFALLASVAAHDREASDAQFLKCLPLAERAASDERNFVKKGVSWALRAIGHRNATLHAATEKVARRLAQSDVASARWVGKDVLKDITRPLVVRRHAERAKKKSAGRKT